MFMVVPSSNRQKLLGPLINYISKQIINKTNSFTYKRSYFDLKLNEVACLRRGIKLCIYAFIFLQTLNLLLLAAANGISIDFPFLYLLRCFNSLSFKSLKS